MAELLEGRGRVVTVGRDEGVNGRRAGELVDAAIDRWVWYAGWSDKIAQIHGSSNPVAGPYFDFSTPEPTGVVAIVAPQASSLLGLVSVVAPAIVSRNTSVVLASQERPLPAVTLTEVLATSDLPRGVSTCSPAVRRDRAVARVPHGVNAIDLAARRRTW